MRSERVRWAVIGLLVLPATQETCFVVMESSPAMQEMAELQALLEG